MTQPDRRAVLLWGLGAALAGCAPLPRAGETGTATAPARSAPSSPGSWRTRAMSFNVLTPNRGAADFDPSVPAEEVSLGNRAPVMAAWIRSADPDVVGLQENEAGTAAHLPVRALGPLLPGYRALHADLDVPLLVRDEAYAVDSADAVDISQGHYSRHLAWARLTSLRTGRALLVANTHLDPYQRPEMARARTAEVSAIVVTLRNLNPGWRVPTLLLGDLNLRPNDPRPEYAAALAKLTKAGLRDAAAIAAKDLSAVPHAASVNGLGVRIGRTWRYRAIRTDGFRYDYVFVSPRLRVRNWQVVTGPGVRRIGGHPYFAAGPLPSDHCPVQAEVVIPPR